MSRMFCERILSLIPCTKRAFQLSRRPRAGQRCNAEVSFTEIYSALTCRQEYCTGGEKFAIAHTGLRKDMELYALQREHKSKFASEPFGLCSY